MVVNSTRQKALELTRSFYDAVSIGAGKTTDFYKMLWIIHWAIEQYGWTKTRESLESLMLSPDFDPAEAPVQLRDAMLTAQSSDDKLAEWFAKAMQEN